MQRSNFFLRTKLLPPRSVTTLLERPRLTEKLRANINSPVTMVAADAGCGKTTLIADFVRNQDRPSVWYQLDHTDADPIVFLTYVAHGIRNVEPGFGEAVLSYLGEASEELLRFPERAVDVLINEMLESLEQPFILVLDDYHHIGRDTAVHKLVDRLLQYSSDLLHLMITTRDLPPLAIMRRRTQAAALIITRDDLLFTDDEVRELFRRTLNVELGDREIADYRNRTHGWITALQLVRQVAEQKLHNGSPDSRIDLTEVLRQSERDIFDYFAEEVLEREAPETQSLLLYLSLLDSLQLDVCSRLFPDLRCSAALPELAQKNVFLTVAGDGRRTEEYRFHPLFRDFLRRRLRSQIGQAGVAHEQKRIADHFLACRQWEQAISYLIDAAEFDRAAEVISRTGGEWIEAGAFISLGLFAEKVPAASLEKHPRSLLHLAEIARLQGDLDRSSLLLHTAARLLAEVKDTAGEAEALHSLASLARRKGRLDDALDLLARAEELAAPDSETVLKCANTRGLCLIGRGDLAAAEQQFRIALEHAERQANERYIRLVTHNLALAPGFRGDFGEALRWFKRIFRTGQPEKQLPQEAIGHLNVARLHLYRGEFDETGQNLERALELCQLYNMRFLRGEIFEAYGNLYREKGDLVHAGEFYERAANAYNEAEIDIAAKELDEERAVFHLLRGESGRARLLLEALIDARGRQGNTTGVNTARLRLYQVDLADGRIDGLADKVRELLTFFREQNHYYYEAMASMLMAEVLFAGGTRAGMVEALQRSLDLSARYDYEHWLRGEIRRNPALFKTDDIGERLPPDLRREIETGPLPKLSEPVAAPAAVIDLTIRVLGPVEIFRDPEKPFAPDAWTTRRARDIFCYIAASKNRRVPKDVLIEAFWPGEDPAAVEKNFHPTISHIRKALNSRQAFKQNFLLFREGAYQLNPELSYLIDAEEFERLIADAETAKRDKDPAALRGALERAHDLYRGQFMEGVYDDWADERRSYYAEQFSRVSAALAKQFLAEKKFTQALKYAQEVLRDDPYREDMHRLILKTFSAQAKPAAVKKHFEEMTALLKDDLGIQPSPETKRLYHDIMAQ